MAKTTELQCSVVVPTYNRPEKVIELVESLQNQVDGKIRFELVLVDDGSTPKIEIGSNDAFPITLVRLDENSGRAAARNAGIAAAQAPLIVFIDDSIRPLPGLLRAYIENVDPEDRYVGLGLVSFAPNIASDRFFEYQKRGRRRLANVTPNLPVDFSYFATGNSAVPTRLLRGVGGFDKRLRVWGGEDTELALRLAKFGAVFVRIEGADALHTNRRKLDDAYESARIFSQQSLPLIFQLHPSFVVEMKAHIWGPSRYASGMSFQRFVRRIATSGLFHRPILLVMNMFPHMPWPDSFYRYILACARRRGLDEAEIKTFNWK